MLLKSPLLAVLTASIFLLLATSNTFAQTVERSPKPGWGDYEVVHEPIYPWWQTVLWYIPNRVLDFTDMLKIDVGVGPSLGAVVRLSRHAQIGARGFYSRSHRLGVLGRRSPYMKESSSEYGVGPYWKESQQRNICPGEFGFGADVVLISFYLGICVDEIWDFVCGFILLDPSNDDIR